MPHAANGGVAKIVRSIAASLGHEIARCANPTFGIRSTFVTTSSSPIDFGAICSAAQTISTHLFIGRGFDRSRSRPANRMDTTGPAEIKVRGDYVIEVLVVDDSKFMAKALGTVLEDIGFKVIGFGHDGVEGLEQFKALHPEVTLLDITMPNMDGLDCLTQILELDRDARVVMLSAIQDPSTIQRCLDLGATAFLQKPIKRGSPKDLNRLCETLENAVGKSVST